MENLPRIKDVVGDILDLDAVKDPKICKWDSCDQIFGNSDALTSHLLIGHLNNNNNAEQSGNNRNKSDFVCKWNGCGRTSTKHKSKIVRHLHIHTEYRPYNCENCHKSFKERSVYTRHKHLNCSDKLYTCEECEKPFATSSSLAVHRRNHWESSTSTLENSMSRSKYVCPEDSCDRAFNDRSNFNKHRKIHLDERPYECQVCKKTFKRSDLKSRHMRTHISDH